MAKALDASLIRRYWTPERQKALIGSKKLLLLPWEAPDVCFEMGLLNPEGSLTRTQTKKLLQVNHMLGLLKPTLTQLKKQFPLLRIAEVAAGNSYVSVLLAWYFTAVDPHPVQIIGTDSNPKVIEQSKARAEKLGFGEKLRFAVRGLEGFDWHALLAELYPESAGSEAEGEEDKKRLRPHFLVALHACDSLSCRAIAHGIELRSDALAIAPCCQAELAAQWKAVKDPAEPLRAIFHSPQLRRTVAADFTDTGRVLLLRTLGYEAEAIEFVPSEHTPKNRLILAHRQKQFDAKSWREWKDIKGLSGGVEITLEKLLKGRLEALGPQLNFSV